MTTIDPAAGIVTLINTFEVAPEKADALVALLDAATEEKMRHVPGFVSANIHKSLDGTRVANYAQWESREAFQAMLADPEAQVHMRACGEIATSFSPVLYEALSCHRS
ncbi:antibiotic biosynthesis monooxygenase [Oceanicola sp. 502str15]|uniref:antibiotic biosynthesis monooxygenase family protein n=1 Tax=Oceanicola sp. 502str15 TaxID=2696061 RepID=UPI0020953C23